MGSINQCIVLVESEETQISWCKISKQFTLIYKSINASFNCIELDRFMRTLNELRDKNFHYYSSNVKRVVVKNTSSQIDFCITKQEVEHLKKMISQAINLIEVFQIIYD